MISRFFIDRPIFASVMSIIITLGGAIAIFQLPVTQYPDITPPTVEVFAVYPGANAQVVADTVASPIEEKVNGVEGMIYMSSQCNNNGEYTLNVTFSPGVDLNNAQILVQQKVTLAQPVLPELVRRRGVTVNKKSPTTLMIINLYSPDDTRDNLYLSNYATIQLRDELSRVSGVADISYLGQRNYSMRLWLDPERMAGRSIAASDVIRAIEQQNIQVAAGQIGQPPAPSDQVFQYTMTTLGRLANENEFGNIIIKSDPQGRLVRMKDVARIELGAQTYEQFCTLDQKPSVALSIYQLPGTNALDTARLVRSKMDELKQRFPTGVDYSIVYDTTPFIDESIREVYGALRDAVILVAIVVLVFLQGWRAAVIPLVAVPVAIIGTFAAMLACQFSLNTLTLFGLVLAIGIVVDDAIVVVEAIEHAIENGMKPRDAAIHAMDQVAGPVIAVALVLAAVFVPCIFITGIIGQFYRQFAVTIAISTIISAFNSLTLSPALAVLLLRPREETQAEALPRSIIMLVLAFAAYLLVPHAGMHPAVMWGAAGAGLVAGWFLARPINLILVRFFQWFNRVFNRTANAYVALIRRTLRFAAVVLVVYAGLLYLTYHLFQVTPAGFIPSQDKGYLLVSLQLPDGASLDRTAEVLQQIEAAIDGVDGVSHTLAIGGQAILSGTKAPNTGTLYVMLKDFHYRSGRNLTADNLTRQIDQVCKRAVSEGIVNVVGAPPIEGLGTAGGFKIVVQDEGDWGLRTLEEVADKIVTASTQTPELADVFTTFRGNTPWLYIDIDRVMAKSLNVSLAEVFSTLQVYFGSLYVNDFNRFDRTWQVNLQADSQYRMQVDDLRRIKVRSDLGQMVPFSSIAAAREVSGPLMLVRYNLHPAAMINGNAGPDTSSGQAIAKMEQVAEANLPQNMHAEWTELALMQQQAGSTAMNAFALSVVLVFLVLAAQYESWALPLAVILVVPLCLLCSLVGVLVARQDVNIFTQIGFVVLVGLACKNAILIVEYARARHDAGASRWDAILEACRLRLRPIIMTSFAFIFGVIPLMIGTGAGAEMRRTLGTAVFAGMLGVTLFGIFLTPVFFSTIQWLVDRRRAAVRAEDDDENLPVPVAPAGHEH